MEPDRATNADRRPWWQRVAWMVAIWGASVLVLGVVAGVIRLWLLR